jgi:UDP-glucose/GDP-mannose dehydrogenase family, NAD binding domain
VTALSSAAVVGLGYIGLPTAVSLATGGLEVVGVDGQFRLIVPGEGVQDSRRPTWMSNASLYRNCCTGYGWIGPSCLPARRSASGERWSSVIRRWKMTSSNESGGEQASQPDVSSEAAAAQVPGGTELAQAIGSLLQALTKASLSAQQEGVGPHVEPVEVTLQIVPVLAGSGPLGVQWRLVGPGDEALATAGAVHSLKVRFSPSESERASEKDAIERRRPPAVSARQSSPQVPGVADQGHDDAVAVAPGRERDVTLVRLRFYARTDRYGPRVRAVLGAGGLVVEQEVATGLRGRNLDGLIQLWKEAHEKQDVGERLLDALASYVSDNIDNAAFNLVRRQGNIGYFLRQTDVTVFLEGCQQWLHSLVEKPLETLGADLGAARPENLAVGSIGADLVLAPVDSAVQRATVIIDIVGIALGAAMGMPPLVMACGHDLGRIGFDQAINRGVSQAFSSLISGRRDDPGKPDPSTTGRPISPPFSGPAETPADPRLPGRPVFPAAPRTREQTARDLNKPPRHPGPAAPGHGGFAPSP